MNVKMKKIKKGVDDMKQEFFASQEHGYVGNIFYDMYYMTEFGELCCLLFYGDYFNNIPAGEKVDLFNYALNSEIKHDKLLLDNNEHVNKVLMRAKYNSADNERRMLLMDF